jgi:hypothetical protein
MTKKAAPRIASEKYSMSVSSLNTGESDSVTFFIVMILLFTNQPSKVRVVLGVLSSQHSSVMSSSHTKYLVGRCPFWGKIRTPTPKFYTTGLFNFFHLSPLPNEFYPRGATTS